MTLSVTRNNGGMQGGTSTSFIQGSNASGSKVQGGSNSVQLLQPTITAQQLQSTTAPGYNQTLTKSPSMQNTSLVTPGGTDTSVSTTDPAAAAAAAKAAADAAKSGQLRGEITNLVNSIKDILNARYGQIDTAAAEQVNKLNSRFTNESQDLTNQITGQTELAGAGAASGGTFDSSYRGNNQDTITTAGQSQIRDLGNELQDNLGTVGGYVQKEKAGLDSQKAGYDATVAHLLDEADPDRLTSLRNEIDSKLRETQAGNADNATQKQSISALETIAPSTARAQQLQVTLSKIVGGTAPTAQKSAIAQSLVGAAAISDAEKQQLLQAFQSDISSTDPNKQQ